MYTGQPEKYISTVFAFSEKGTFSCTAAAFIRYLTAPGGTTAPTTEYAVVIPRNGVLKNLYWSAEASTLTAAGNKITVYVNGNPTGLTVIWNGGAPFVKSGSNTGTTVPVVAGDKVSVHVQLAAGQNGKTIDKPRVSFELEVAAQEPNPWDLTGTIVSYTAGKVGIGTAAPTDQLHVKNAAAGGIAGVFETPATGKILSGKVGATEKFSVDGGGNLYASGKVGIGTTTPATELDVIGTVKMQGFRLSPVLPTPPPVNGHVLTSDGSGNGTWQPTGGAAGTIEGNGTVNAIPKFLGSTTLDDSVIFDNGGSIGIGTSTPGATLEVNGTVQLGGNGVHVNLAGNVGIGTANPTAALTVTKNSNSWDNGVRLLDQNGSNEWNLHSDTNGRFMIGRVALDGLHIDAVGNVFIGGTLTQGSSKRWKTNIRTIKGALNKVQRLRGISYNQKVDDKRTIGLVAEEVGEVIPEIVTYEENGKDAQGLDYSRLVAVLIEAVKEQQGQIEELKDTVKSLLVDKSKAAGLA